MDPPKLSVFHLHEDEAKAWQVVGLPKDEAEDREDVAVVQQNVSVYSDDHLHVV